jgi:hypothetical protein
MSRSRHRNVQFSVVEQGNCKILILNNAKPTCINSPSVAKDDAELISMYNKMREIASERARLSYLRRELDFLQRRVKALHTY